MLQFSVDRSQLSLSHDIKIKS